MSQPERQSVFLAGGTGYMGSRLAAMLLERGHEVRALTRIPSAARLPVGCHPVFGSAVVPDTTRTFPRNAHLCILLAWRIRARPRQSNFAPLILRHCAFQLRQL